MDFYKEFAIIKKEEESKIYLEDAKEYENSDSEIKNLKRLYNCKCSVHYDCSFKHHEAGIMNYMHNNGNPIHKSHLINVLCSHRFDLITNIKNIMHNGDALVLHKIIKNSCLEDDFYLIKPINALLIGGRSNQQVEDFETELLDTVIEVLNQENIHEMFYEVERNKKHIYMFITVFRTPEDSDIEVSSLYNLATKQINNTNQNNESLSDILPKDISLSRDISLFKAKNKPFKAKILQRQEEKEIDNLLINTINYKLSTEHALFCLSNNDYIVYDPNVQQFLTETKQKCIGLNNVSYTISLYVTNTPLPIK